jgi:putative ABC transport system permease protein
VRAVLLGLAAAVVAAILPAWRAARQPPVETIRGRWQERDTLSLRLLWRIRGTILVGTAAGVVTEVVFESVNAGLIATALISIGTALDARLLVCALHQIANTKASKQTRPIVRFAIAQLSGYPRRAALTAGTLGVGLGMVFWLCIVAKSFEASVVRITSDAFHADLIASSSYVSSGFLESPIDDRLLDELLQFPEISKVAGERLITWKHQGIEILINAFDRDYFLEPGFGHFELVGDQLPKVWEKLATGELALASRSFELTFGIHPGDEIVLLTPNGPHRLQIGGITKEQFVNGAIQISRDLYKQLWNDNRITRALILKKPEAATADVRESIVHALGTKYHLRVLLASELVEYFSAQVRRAFAAIPILAGLVLAIVLIGLADTLAANVADRVREFGTTRAVGVRRSFLWCTVGLEAIILGALGIVLALSMGLVLGLLWIRCIFPVLAGWVEFSIPIGQSLVVIVVAMAVCLLAALEPARRLSLIQPADALRYE